MLAIRCWLLAPQHTRLLRDCSSHSQPDLAQHNGLHEPTAYTLATFLSKQSNRIGLGIFVRRNSSKRTGWATWLRATMQIPMWCLSRGARTSESYLYEAWKALTRKNQETSWLALLWREDLMDTLSPVWYFDSHPLVESRFGHPLEMVRSSFVTKQHCSSAHQLQSGRFHRKLMDNLDIWGLLVLDRNSSTSVRECYPGIPKESGFQTILPTSQVSTPGSHWHLACCLDDAWSKVWDIRTGAIPLGTCQGWKDRRILE